MNDKYLGYGGGGVYQVNEDKFTQTVRIYMVDNDNFYNLEIEVAFDPETLKWNIVRQKQKVVEKLKDRSRAWEV